MFDKKLLTTLLVLFVTFALVGCGMQNSPAPTPVAEELPLANDALSSVNRVASMPSRQILDATPDPDGQMVYFTASGGEAAGVFKVAADGGEVTAVATGTPFVAPLGIAISTDGQTLYVADSSSGLYALSVAGGAPTLIAGTEGTMPQVPEVVNQNSQDQLYFSGTSGNEAAVFKMPTDGGAAPTVILQGAPLVNPSGVAITKEGVVYVVDMAAAGNGLGSVFRIQNGAAEAIATNVHTDEAVAGATLTLDESALLVSHLHPQNNSAQVLIINLSTLEMAIFDKVIGANHSAGGVHRAHNTGQLAWAGYMGGGAYFLEP